MTDLLKNLKSNNAISKGTYNKLRPVGSKPGMLYGSVKVQKPIKNRLPPLGHILSATGTTTYKLEIF